MAINGKVWRESCFLVLLFCRLGWEKSLFPSASSTTSLWTLSRLSRFSAYTAWLKISKPPAYGWKGWRTFYGKRFVLIESVKWIWSYNRFCALFFDLASGCCLLCFVSVCQWKNPFMQYFDLCGSKKCEQYYNRLWRCHLKLIFYCSWLRY